MILFVLVGAIVGVTLARLRTTGARSATRATPAGSANEATSRAASPRSSLAHDPRVPQRELEPTDPRYDPLALQDEEQLSTKEIFEREPRDPTYAPILEQRIHDVYDVVFRELQLQGVVRGVHVECKTLSCYTYVQVPKADVKLVYEKLNGILLGDVQSPSYRSDTDPDLADVTIYNLYRPAARDDSYHKRFLEAAMRPKLEFIKRTYLKDQD